uniref:Pentatricopeptide repeat-containing protein n=1 Tax=Nymphaea colorata TaxID=210225 RepID=A0A5K0VLQ4_9MAGN
MTIAFSALIGSGCVDDAQKVFNEKPHRDVVSWTTMIAAFVHKEKYKEVLKWFLLVQKDGGDSMYDGFACTFDLREFGVSRARKCGDISIEHDVLDRLPQRNMVTWCCMLSAHC